MLKKILSFLFFCVLITKLFYNLCIFGAQYIFLKLKLKKEATPILLFILLLIWLINWQLWQNNKTPQVKLKDALSQNPGEILFTLDQTEIETLKNFYLTLETKQKHSRDIHFNLGKLLELENTEKAQKKFQQSWDLDPNY
jgi:predicted negative regulator of RcsB-dependent stress response